MHNPGSLRMHHPPRVNFAALFYAIFVHLVLAVLLVLSMDWTPKIQHAAPKANIINAVVVDQARLDQLQEAKARQREEAERQQRLQAEAEMEQRRQQEEAQRQVEEQQRKAEEARLNEIRIKERKKTEEAEKKKKLKAEQEARERKQAEQKRLAEAEAKRKLEAEQRRKAEEARRLEAEQALKEQLAAEQKMLDAERARKMQSVLAEYTVLIRQKVERNWKRPVDAKKGMSCTVKVRLIPGRMGGQVVQAQVVKSCGDALVDRSVEAAVYKSEPLPLPPDPTMFDQFREISFVFKPEE